LKQEALGAVTIEAFKEGLPFLLIAAKQCGEKSLHAYEASEDEISMLNAAVGPIYDYPSVSWISTDADQVMRRTLEHTLFGQVYRYCIEQGYEPLVGAAGKLTEIVSLGIEINITGQRV
jgi:hypothetical protein